MSVSLSFLVLLLSSSPTFTDHLELNDVVFTDASTNPPTEYDEPDENRVRQNINSWLDYAENRGSTIFRTTAFELEGVVYFNSPTMQKAGFTLAPEGPFLEWLFQEAGKRTLGVEISIEFIAHIVFGLKPFDPRIQPSELTPSAVSSLIQELFALANASGVTLSINEEAFDDSYTQAVEDTTNSLGIQYFRYFWDASGRADVWGSEDYSTYPRDPRNNPGDAAYMMDLVSYGTLGNRLGMLELTFAGARTLGIETSVVTSGGWGFVPGTQVGVSLYRAVQYAPQNYSFVAASYNEGDNQQDYEFVFNYNYADDLLPLLEQYARKPTDLQKPIANLIVLEPSSDDVDHYELFTSLSMGAIETLTNAVNGAGYDLFVTFDGPYNPPAEPVSLYMVYALGKDPDTEQSLDLPTPVADLFQGSVPVFLQTVGGLGEGGNWSSVRNALGLSETGGTLMGYTDTPIYEPIPETVTVSFPSGDAELFFRGHDFEIENQSDAGHYPDNHFLEYIPVASYSGQVLLQGVTNADEDGTFDDPTALLVKNGNMYYLAANMVHLDMSIWLANVLAPNPYFNSPTYLYASVGSSRCAFFAAGNTPVDIQLPLNNGILKQWSASGQTVMPSTLDLSGNHLTGTLKKWETAIITSDRQPVFQHVSYLPHYTFKSGSWSTRVTLMNPITQSQRITLTAYSNLGEEEVSATHMLAGNGAISADIQTLLPGLQEDVGWLKIAAETQSVPGIMTFTFLSSGGTSSLPTTDESGKKLLFPLIENSSQWLSGFAITNVTETESTLKVKAYSLDGTLLKEISTSLAPKAKTVAMAGDFFGITLPEHITIVMEGNQSLTGFALSFSTGNENIVAVPASISE